MRALIVSAAPRHRSLTHSLAVTAAETLRQQDCRVDLLDLHVIGWNPVVHPHDFSVEEFSMPVGEHARAAHRASTLSPEVRHHQSLLRDADLVIFVFPLWWGGMPAILKGWVDRIFTDGFAYGLRDADNQPRKYGDGAFTDKTGLLITTAGERASAFTGRGVNGSVDDLLFPINHGVFWYTGMRVLAPIALLGTDTPLWEGDDTARTIVRRRLSDIRTQPPLPYRRMLTDYDDQRILHPSIHPGRHDLAIHTRAPSESDTSPLQHDREPAEHHPH